MREQCVKFAYFKEETAVDQRSPAFPRRVAELLFPWKPQKVRSKAILKKKNKKQNCQILSRFVILQKLLHFTFL